MKEAQTPLINDDKFAIEAWRHLGLVDYEFVSVIRAKDGAMEVLSRREKSVIPFLLSNNTSYQDNLHAFVNKSVVKEKKEEAVRELTLDAVIAKLKKASCFRPVFPVKLLDGTLMFKRWSYSYIDNAKEYILFARSDVTEASFSESDAISGVPSKERLAVNYQKLTHSHPLIRYLCLYIDLDGFRTYNQLFGLDEGDKLINFLGTDLTKITGRHGLIGHLIADNFVMIMPEESFDREKFNAFYKELSDFNVDYSFSLSIGIAKCGFKRLYREAVEEAHLANRSLKGIRGLDFAYYDESLREESVLDQSIISRLHKGLTNHEFEVYIQPIIDSRTAKVAMGEALVRWNVPGTGLIQPNSFITILEKNGFISELDKYVRDEVYMYIKNRENEGKPTFPISVNISRSELEEPDFALRLAKDVDDAKISRSLIRLEIKEGLFVANGSSFLKTIEELRNNGFYLEMDDFGSGYSSLSIFREVPFDLLKLDMRFFEGNGTEKAKAIVAASLQIASALGMEVIAEGVEKLAQVSFLAENGAYLIQGFVYSKPLPLPSFDEYLASH